MSRTGFRTGISLHSHTLYSRERLDSVYRMAGRSPLLRMALRYAGNRHRAAYGTPLDLSRIWWTPPVCPMGAWRIESRQIEQLDMRPIVSLSDHDSIEAPCRLRNELAEDIPVSVEWTLPYRGAEFHIGIHNLPIASAREFMDVLSKCTIQPQPGGPAAVLKWVALRPEILIVFNHPCWDEIRAGEEIHRAALHHLLQHCGEFIHALEWNGLRTRADNQGVVELAKAYRKPVVSGGDRHGLEANTVLNMTNAGTFSEFAEEVRAGCSQLFITKNYWKCYALRVVRMVEDALCDQPDHGYGWTRWTDRVFYQNGNDEIRSFSQLWSDKAPALLRAPAALAHLARWKPAGGWSSRRPLEIIDN